MKIKAAEATERQIDFLVAKIENKLWLDYENALNNETPIPPRPSEYLRDNDFHPDHFQPSTNREQGGPIIERWIDAQQRFRGADGSYIHVATIHGGTIGAGATGLIAGLRCLIIYKMGYEVEIPDELVSA